MPIDPDFPRNHQTIGKHKHADGEHYHFIWGPGRSDAETAITSAQQSLSPSQYDEKYNALILEVADKLYNTLLKHMVISIMDNTPAELKS